MCFDFALVGVGYCYTIYDKNESIRLDRHVSGMREIYKSNETMAILLALGIHLTLTWS